MLTRKTAKDICTTVYETTKNHNPDVLCMIDRDPTDPDVTVVGTFTTASPGLPIAAIHMSLQALACLPSTRVRVIVAQMSMQINDIAKEVGMRPPEEIEEGF